MHSVLTKKYGVSARNVGVLADDGARGHKVPTRRNIIAALRRLIATRKRRIWFAYSGHGGRVRDQNGEEADGRDETLVPSDYLSAGQIRDDVIAGLLRRLAARSSFVAIYDCCHSGSMSDLPISFRATAPGKAIQASTKDVYRLSEKPGQIVSLSACSDPQTSLSVYDIENQRKWQGALTYAFSKLPKAPETSGAEVLGAIHAIMKREGYPQITTLSTNRSDATHSNDIRFPFPR